MGKQTQQAAIQQTALATMMSGSAIHGPPALHLPVRRDHMGEDIISLLVAMGAEIDNNAALPLKIQFADEEGIDDGGLTRELVSSASRTIFSPEFAMFRVSESGYVTIDPCSPLTQDEFQAVGRFRPRLLQRCSPRHPFPHLLSRPRPRRHPRGQRFGQPGILRTGTPRHGRSGPARPRSHLVAQRAPRVPM